MSEHSLSRRLVSKLGPRLLYLDRIENSVGTGTPDMYGESFRWPFWMELKHCHDYPKQPTTPIRFKRYTLDQAKCIARYGESGRQGSWILIQVAADHWLFDHTKAHDLHVNQPLVWWEENAFQVWKHRLDYDQLAGIL